MKKKQMGPTKFAKGRRVRVRSGTADPGNSDLPLGGWVGTTENFVRIGHSLIALLVGWLGGLLSRRLWRASRPPEPETVGLA